MTDRARELLERTAEILELLFEGPNDVDPNTLAMLGDTRLEEIRTYLARSEQDEEPVARLHITETDTYPVIDVEVLNGEMLQPSMSPINVYTIQQKPFVRLSEEEIEKLMDSALAPKEIDERDLHYFARAVMDALEEKNK